MYDNALIYGKQPIQNIVSVEVEKDNLLLFLEKDGVVSTEAIPNKFWIITNKKVSSKQLPLEGDQWYKWIGKFNSVDEKNKIRQLLRKEHVDFFDIYDAKEASLVYNGLTYFKGLKPKDISILSFDIETTSLTHTDQAKVLLISNTYRCRDKIVKKLFAYNDYASDIEMIEAWCSWVREINPSLMCGHNIYGFDFLYLNYIAKKNGKELLLGRDSSPIKINNYISKFRVDGSNDIDYSNIQIYGREIVDTLFLSYKFDIKKKYNNYSLKQIIKQEGLEKKNRQHYDASKIRFKYKDTDEWKKIKQYAVDDSDDALHLFDLMGSSMFYFTQSVPRSFQQIINTATGSQINSFLIRAYLQDGYSIPKTTRSDLYVEGGISFAIPGVYRNIYKVDLKSCYPSQVLRFKIFDEQKDPKGYFYEMVKYFTYERFDLKEKYKETKDISYYDREQSSKIFINSAYGALNTQGLNFNNPVLAAKITYESRKIIDMALKWASGKNVDYWMTEFKNKVGKEVDIES